MNASVKSLRHKQFDDILMTFVFVFSLRYLKTTELDKWTHLFIRTPRIIYCISHHLIESSDVFFGQFWSKHDHYANTTELRQNSVALLKKIFSASSYLPAPGSVIAMALTQVPSIMRGTNLSICSFVPKWLMYGRTISECRENPTPEQFAYHLHGTSDVIDVVSSRPTFILVWQHDAADHLNMCPPF